MTGAPGRVLVVCHEGSRTGAPRVAAEITRTLVNGGWEVRVVLRWPGPMKREFERAGARVTLEPLRRIRAGLRLRRSTARFANLLEQVAAAVQIVRSRPDLVWCNTVLSACYVRPARLLRRQVILHAHEPAARMIDVLSRYNLGRYWPDVLTVGCAPHVCEDLSRVTGRNEVTCIPSVPDVDRVLRLAEDPGPGLPQHGVLVGACGLPNQGKGVDLWLDLAGRVSRDAADLDPHFVWIGGPAPAEVAESVAGSDLRHRVTFLESMENPYPAMRSLDVFTLPSRADSFPLVVLEAMTLARPIVAFSVGDVAYQIGEAGVMVPPSDVTAAARAVVALLRDARTRTRLGELAADRVSKEFSTGGFADKVRAVASSAVAHGPVPPSARR